ncbi:Diacylglycerol lipase-beta [Taenia solium]|eukprot:TsM_000965700 transcript=TsM_000965700 gene=TsM_000965700
MAGVDARGLVQTFSTKWSGKRNSFYLHRLLCAKKASCKLEAHNSGQQRCTSIILKAGLRPFVGSPCFSCFHFDDFDVNVFAKRVIHDPLGAFSSMPASVEKKRTTLRRLRSISSDEIVFDLGLQAGGDAETHPFLSPPDKISIGCCICKHDTCNLAVYQEITGAPIESLVYYSFVNNVYQSPFFVAIDDDSESIIIAVRGTLSPEDVIVDMLAEGKRPLPDELPPDVPAEQILDFYVHMGILYTARNLRDIILRLQLVEKARVRRPCYPLVVCGHSLGAGVASVLAFLLRNCHPEVKAYAYSPPLGARMARYCKPFVVSIVLGCDIVPRLSIPTLNDLKWRLLSALQDCNVPKYRILANAVRIVGLNCLFPSFCRPSSTTIGLDTRLFSASCQYNLLRPKVFSPRGAPAISSSTEYSDFVTESTASLHRPVRYLSENRSLFRWLRAKTDVLLRTDASGTIYVPFVSALRSSEFSTITASGSVEVNEPIGAHGDFVSMDTSVRFAGLIVHLVQVEDTELRTSASLRSDSSTSSPWCQDQLAHPPVAIWSNSRQFQTIIIHPRMLSDHLPDEVSTALYRLYTATCQSDSPLLSGNVGPLDPRALIRRLKKPAH